MSTLNMNSINTDRSIETGWKTIENYGYMASLYINIKPFTHPILRPDQVSFPARNDYQNLYKNTTGFRQARKLVSLEFHLDTV